MIAELITTDGQRIPYPPADVTYTLKELGAVDSPAVTERLIDGTLLIVTMNDPRSDKVYNRLATRFMRATGFNGVVRGDAIRCSRGLYRRVGDMTQASLFDWVPYKDNQKLLDSPLVTEGVVAKKNVMDDFEDRAAPWLKEARKIAKDFCNNSQFGTVTSDDLRELIDPPPGIGAKIFGAVFRVDFIPCGSTHTKRPEGHGRAIRVWRVQ